MTPDKKTLNLSDVNALTRLLISRKEKYHLGVLGKVEAVGINDDISLRILIYRGGVVLEQLRRLNDDEENDVIVSTSFNLNECPDKWPLEKVGDYYNYTDCKEFQNYVSVIKFKQFIEPFLK